MSKEVDGKHYEGLASAYDDGRFINYSTLCGVGDVSAKISEVIGLGPEFTFENGRKLGKKMLCLRFEGKKKVLRLNSGNLRIIQRNIGNVTKDWVGKEINLYADPTVKFGGKEVGGIKIRDI
jgi:hypothetical protein